MPDHNGGTARDSHQLTMTLAAPKRLDHDVNFMIEAVGAGWRGGQLKGTQA